MVAVDNAVIVNTHGVSRIPAPIPRQRSDRDGAPKLEDRLRNRPKHLGKRRRGGRARHPMRRVRPRRRRRSRRWSRSAHQRVAGRADMSLQHAQMPPRKVDLPPKKPRRSGAAKRASAQPPRRLREPDDDVVVYRRPPPPYLLRTGT